MHKFILGQYKNLNLAEPKGFDQKDLEKAVLESILNTVDIWCKQNTTVEEGDVIIIKVEAKESGILVPEFCQNKLQYKVGDESYLKEFMNAIGKKMGESFSMEIDFDESCVIERIRNKKVNLYATITDVIDKKIPEITDDLVQKMEPDCRTLDEMKAKYAAILKSRGIANIYQQKRDLVLKTIIDNSSYEFDEDEFDQALNTIIEQTKKSIMDSNSPDIDRIMQINENDVYFRMECERVTRRMIMENLVINGICNMEQIEVTAEEFALEKAKYTEDEAASEEFTKYFPTDQSFELYLLREKVLHWLCLNNFNPKI